MIVLAIDPGTKAGVALIEDDNFVVDSWNVAAEKATKILANGTQKRKGEPKYFRLKHLWDKLEEWFERHGYTKIVCEGAAGFQRGKSAVESSHKYRAVVELFCALKGIEYLEVPPNDLKFFALGKRSGDKDEMIASAKSMGYDGNNDDEADSYLIAKWYLDTKKRLNELKS